MRTYQVGETVKKGYYVNRRSFELLTIEQDGGELQGTVGSRYLRVPWPLLVMLAPVVGGAFVFFLPAIGFAMVLYYLAKLGYRLGARGIHALVPVGVTGFAPGEATLARRWKNGSTPAGEAAGEGTTPTRDKLAELEKDIAERRNGRDGGA
jgi:hypothetical protein